MLKRIRIAVAMFAMIGLTACASLPESLVTAPRVQLSHVQVVGLGFTSQTFLLSFDVTNPNSFSLPIRSVSYGVKLDGQRFASGETQSEFSVPADGSAEFAISVDLNLLQSAPQLLAIVRDGARRELPYELNGQFGVDIPFTPPLRYRSQGLIRLESGSY
jgi:LEA14-like dessication related protein